MTGTTWSKRKVKHKQLLFMQKCSKVLTYTDRLFSDTKQDFQILAIFLVKQEILGLSSIQCLNAHWIFPKAPRLGAAALWEAPGLLQAWKYLLELRSGWLQLNLSPGLSELLMRCVPQAGTTALQRLCDQYLRWGSFTSCLLYDFCSVQSTTYVETGKSRETCGKAKCMSPELFHALSIEVPWLLYKTEAWVLEGNGATGCVCPILCSPLTKLLWEWEFHNPEKEESLGWEEVGRDFQDHISLPNTDLRPGKGGGERGPHWWTFLSLW